MNIQPKHAATIEPGKASAVIGRKLRFDYRCSACGSRNVAHDATVRWDAALQRFILSGVLDYCSCQDCGADDDTGAAFFVKLED
jgi:hypothetical protein